MSSYKFRVLASKMASVRSLPTTVHRFPFELMVAVNSQCRVQRAVQHVHERSLARYTQYLHSDSVPLGITEFPTTYSQLPLLLMQPVSKHTSFPSTMNNQFTDQSRNDSQTVGGRDAGIHQSNMYSGFTPAYQCNNEYTSAPYFKHQQLEYDLMDETPPVSDAAPTGEPSWEINMHDAASHGIRELVLNPNLPQSRRNEYQLSQPADIEPALTNNAPIVQQQHMPPQTLSHPSSGLLFSSLAEAQANIAARGWRSPSPDDSIPTTNAQRQQIVLRLLAAISSIDDVYDKQQGTNFRKRWLSQLNGALVYYQDADKEQIAWDILSLAESLHVHGPSVFTSFDTVFWRQTTGTRDWTFAFRMNKIVELLTMSKARCEKLLAGLSLQTVVGHPAYLIRMTKGNGKQNGKRQKLLKVGRAARNSEA